VQRDSSYGCDLVAQSLLFTLIREGTVLLGFCLLLEGPPSACPL